MCKLHTKIFITFVLIEVEASTKYWKFQKNNIHHVCSRCTRARLRSVTMETRKITKTRFFSCKLQYFFTKLGKSSFFVHIQLLNFVFFLSFYHQNWSPVRGSPTTMVIQGSKNQLPFSTCRDLEWLGNIGLYKHDKFRATNVQIRINSESSW